MKAAIIERQMGCVVSDKTVAREEGLARRIAEAVRSPAIMPKERQAEMYAAMEP